MLTITKQSDYGIIFLSHLLKKKTVVSLNDLIAQTRLPKRFLAKIGAILVREKLLVSREGKNGGYMIGEKIKKMSLYDYLMLFENNLAVCSCDDSDYHCDFEQVCTHKSVLKNEINKTFLDQLKKTKLIKLLK